MAILEIASPVTLFLVSDTIEVGWETGVRG